MFFFLVPEDTFVSNGINTSIIIYDNMFELKTIESIYYFLLGEEILNISKSNLYI